MGRLTRNTSSRSLGHVLLAAAIWVWSQGAHADEAAEVAWQEAEQLRSDGKWSEAMTAYQRVVDDYPGSVEQAAWALYRTGGRQWELSDQDAAIATFERIYRDYPTSTIVTRGFYSYTMGIFLVLGKQDYGRAIEITQEALAKYGEMSGSPKATTIVYLAMAQMRAGDLATAKKTLVTRLPDCLFLLNHKEYWDLLGQIHTAQKDFDGALTTARLAYALCDFDEKPVKDMVDLVRRIYVLRGEFPRAMEFVAAQEDADRPNPLRSVSIPAVTDETRTKMVRAAMGDQAVLSLIDIYCGDCQRALEDAMMYMAAASGDEVATSIRAVARVYKAADLDVVRANQLMDFVRTGEGPNPLADPEL